MRVDADEREVRQEDRRENARAGRARRRHNFAGASDPSRVVDGTSPSSAASPVRALLRSRPLGRQ
jgi:hypothetical protein